MVAAVLAIVAAGLASVQSLYLLRRLAPRRLVGDELEYAGRARHRFWVRVPAFGVLIRALMRLSRAPAGPGTVWPARVGNIVLAGAAVGLATLAAAQAGGVLAGLVAAALMLASLERALLAIHLWPEQLLGLLLVAFVMLVPAAATAPGAFGLAAVAGMAVLVRLDSLALLGAAGVLAGLGHPAALGPTLLGQAGALALASVWNRRRHGVTAPDTTLAYNLAIWRRDRAQAGVTTEAMQQAEAAERRGGDSRAPADRTSLPLGRGLAALAVRFATLLGRETFLSDRMLDPAADLPRYRPRARERLRRWLGGALRWGTTLEVGLAALLLPLMPGAVVVPVVASLLAAGLVATRSRYRVPVLPALAAGIGMAVAALASGAAPWSDLVPGVVLLAGLGGLLAAVAPRADGAR